MRSAVIAALSISLQAIGAQGAGDTARCSATDYAPETIAILAQPVRGAKTLASLPRDDAATLVNLDAMGSWLKVRAGAVTGWVPSTSVFCRLSPEDARAAVAREAGAVIAALKARQAGALAAAVHPAKGVRLSPYGTVDPKADRVFTGAQLNGIFESPVVRVWGFDDGSEKPIRLTFGQYYKKYVYNRDFAGAPQITYNAPDQGTDKAWEAYPSAIVVDYHFPDTGETPAVSLRLVFERHNSKWYLSGIIHDGWSI